MSWNGLTNIKEKYNKNFVWKVTNFLWHSKSVSLLSFHFYSHRFLLLKKFSGFFKNFTNLTELVFVIRKFLLIGYCVNWNTIFLKIFGPIVPYFSVVNDVIMVKTWSMIHFGNHSDFILLFFKNFIRLNFQMCIDGISHIRY